MVFLSIEIVMWFFFSLISFACVLILVETPHPGGNVTWLVASIFTPPPHFAMVTITSPPPPIPPPPPHPSPRSLSLVWLAWIKVPMMHGATTSTVSSASTPVTNVPFAESAASNQVCPFILGFLFCFNLRFLDLCPHMSRHDHSPFTVKSTSYISIHTVCVHTFHSFVSLFNETKVSKWKTASKKSFNFISRWQISCGSYQTFLMHLWSSVVFSVCLCLHCWDLCRLYICGVALQSTSLYSISEFQFLTKCPRSNHCPHSLLFCTLCITCNKKYCITFIQNLNAFELSVLYQSY